MEEEEEEEAATRQVAPAVDLQVLGVLQR